MYESWIKASVLRFRLPLIKARITSARKLLYAFLKRAERPYLAYSTGKDSGVVLDMALKIRPDLPILFFDDLWHIPGTDEQIEAIEQHYEIRVLRIRHRNTGVEFRRLYGVSPYHHNPPAVDAEFGTLKAMVDHYGYDGVILGLRSQESTARYFALKTPLREVQYDGLWHVSPIHDWSYQDVWAYLAGNTLPIHPAYQQMMDAGDEPEFARVGPLTAVRVYQYGSLNIVKYLWPDVWNQFVSDNPCVVD